MTDFIKFSRPDMLQEAVQSLLEGKRIARSLENTVDALIPVIENEETVKKLEEIRESAAKASHTLQRLYNSNARDAFGGLRASDTSARAGMSHTPNSPDATKTNES